jgi:hypothetical protein
MDDLTTKLGGEPVRGPIAHRLFGAGAGRGGMPTEFHHPTA